MKMLAAQTYAKKVNGKVKITKFGYQVRWNTKPRKPARRTGFVWGSTPKFRF